MPPAWGTAWAGSGWPLKGQCWGKDKRWRPRGGGWVPAWPVLGVRRIQAGKAVISVYRCRCGGVQLGVGGLLAQSADWELEGQDSHQGLGSGICNSSVRWALKDAVLTRRVGPGLSTWGMFGTVRDYGGDCRGAGRRVRAGSREVFGVCSWEVCSLQMIPKL